MRRFALPLLALTLSACATTSVIEDDEKTLPESDAAFNLSEPVVFDKSQSYVSFLGKSSIINHEGEFETFDVTMDLDDDAPADLTKAKLEATIDLTSAKTDAEGLNGHLQKADFFDTAQFPEATFTSTSIVSTGGNMYDVLGDLTVKGKTMPVTMKAEITDAYVLADFDMPRKEFGVGNDSYGEKLLDETVPVQAKLVFLK